MERGIIGYLWSTPIRFLGLSDSNLNDRMHPRISFDWVVHRPARGYYAKAFARDVPATAVRFRAIPRCENTMTRTITAARNDVPQTACRIVGLQLVFTLLLSALAGSSAFSQPYPKRFALIIANSQYAGLKPLVSAVNDAEAIANEFRRLEFDVGVEKNVGMDRLKGIIATFISKSPLARRPSSISVALG